MGKVEAVILDWAGTTVDYGCFAPVDVFMKVFAERGIFVTEKETREPMGMLKRDHIRAMLAMPRIGQLWLDKYGGPYTEADVDCLYECFEPMLLASLHEHAELKPGVLQTVARLREEKIKIGSTTGFTDNMMEIVTREAKRQGYAPDCWFSPDAVNGIGRPYPYMIFKNMETLVVKSVRNVVKIGDTVSDLLEAKNAGVWAVGIIDGSSEMGLTEEAFMSLSDSEKESRRQSVRQVYEKTGADFVVTSLEEIFSVIREIEKQS